MWADLTALFAVRCGEGGLDLVQPFRVDWWNRAAGNSEKLPDFGRPETLGLVVGNTRVLWERFQVALRADGRLLRAPNPLDTYVETVVTRAMNLVPKRTLVLWGHVTEPSPIPIQRIAESAGLASLSPGHLSVHPEYGPWIALRAVVIVDVPGPLLRPRTPGRCDSCPEPCVPALQEALGGATQSGLPMADAIRRDWRPWVRIRDVCPEGREHRYSDDQIEYHYAKPRALSGSASP